MKPLMLVGIILIVVGCLALVYQGITYTRTEKVVDLGPLEISKENKDTLPLPPILGVVALIGGVALTYLGSKK